MRISEQHCSVRFHKLHAYRVTLEHEWHCVCAAEKKEWIVAKTCANSSGIDARRISESREPEVHLKVNTLTQRHLKGRVDTLLGHGDCGAEEKQWSTNKRSSERAHIRMRSHN